MRFIVLLLFFLFSCSHQGRQKDQSHQVMATLWLQNAAEVHALRYQAYNMAKSQIERSLRKRSSKKRAVVLDLDETVLDNSPFQAWMILDERGFEPEKWQHWIDLQQAQALHGAREFLNFASSQGVEIFYVSNRQIKTLESTYQNLKKQNLPVKRQNIFLKTTTNSKLARRRQILKDHEIVLLIGDNLGDFSEAFDEKSNNDRAFLVEKWKSDFGRKFIVLPNPMYGDWEQALYHYDSTRSDSQKRRDRLRHLYPMGD